MKFEEIVETVSYIRGEEECELKIDVKRDEGFVCVWLTNDDQKDEKVQAWLKEQYPIWREQKLMPVVYYSGHEDLYENTLALLLHNRRLSAQKEVEAEKRVRKHSGMER